MTPKAGYATYANIRTVNADDEVIELEGLYTALSFDQIESHITGEIIKLPLHIARHPDWYFHKVTDMVSHRPRVTQEDYIRELVRGTPGLLGSCYWDIGIMEGWFPCENACASNASFTATLSKLGFEMRKDGEVVKGIKHNTRDCTYHIKTVKKNLDGLFVA